jgi:protein-S-isoprenylcysteine O-methyltransferase Ste14
METKFQLTTPSTPLPHAWSSWDTGWGSWRLGVSRTTVADWAARAIVCVMFGALCVNILQEFMRTGHFTGLMLLVSESLVIVLTLARRPAKLVDRSIPAGIVTLVSVAGPPLMRADGNIAALAPDMLTVVVSAVALLLILSGKVTLGRSFGLVPANRGVVVQGPYAAVRHPIYTGYLVTHIAFLAAHPSMWNIAVVIIADGALVARALMEERVLSKDALYRAYCQRVAWHLVPGVF